MDGRVGQDEPIEYDIDDQDAGTTLILTETGWETTEYYMDPGDDWGLMPDGSYLSPDGLIRTFPQSVT